LQRTLGKAPIGPDEGKTVMPDQGLDQGRA
jgi:hypothetical protein